MLEWVKKMLISKWAGSAARHLMSVVAGFLLAIGVAPELVEKFTASGSEILVAVIVYLVAQAWSFAEKKRE